VGQRLAHVDHVEVAHVPNSQPALHGESWPLDAKEAVADAVLEQPGPVKVAHGAMVFVVVPAWRDKWAQGSRLLVPTRYERRRRLTQCQVNCAEIYRLIEAPFLGREDACIGKPDGRRVESCRELRKHRTMLVEHSACA
jgi:hypothetical protein